MQHCSVFGSQFWFPHVMGGSPPLLPVLPPPLPPPLDPPEPPVEPLDPLPPPEPLLDALVPLELPLGPPSSVVMPVV
jgi:hypothetical protein